MLLVVRSLIDWLIRQSFFTSIIVVTTAWAIVLAFIWLAPWGNLDLKKQAADRILSTIHAVVSSALGICALIYTQPTCSAKEAFVPASMLVLLGYLYVDLFSMLVCDGWNKWRKLDLGMIFHHLFILFCFSLGLIYDIGVWFGVSLLCNELSTPCVNFHWYLIHTDRKASQAFFVNGLTLLGIFTLCRMIFIPYSFYLFAAQDFCYWSNNANYKWASWVMGLGYFVLFAMNSVWYVSLVRGASKRLCPARTKLK